MDIQRARALLQKTGKLIRLMEEMGLDRTCTLQTLRNCPRCKSENLGPAYRDRTYLSHILLCCDCDLVFNQWSIIKIEDVPPNNYV
jgi:transcription elongation factor Elf1